MGLGNFSNLANPGLGQPQQLGRDFVIGYFLPVAAFIAANLGLSVAFGADPGSLKVAEILAAIALLTLSSALGGELLLVLNGNLIRLMEGYAYRRLNGFQRWRYRRLSGLVATIREEREALSEEGKELSLERRAELEKTVSKLVTYFPDDEKWVLPTALGNTIRAFEIYPRVMYGLDAVEGWGRLLGVVPTEYREQIGAAKTQMDFWVNSWLLALLFLPEYAAFAAYEQRISVPWSILAAVAVAVVATYSAKNAAVQWGNLVKASFDLFLPELWNKLGFSPDDFAEKERVTWESFGWAVHYRAPRYLPERRSPPSDGSDESS